MNIVKDFMYTDKVKLSILFSSTLHIDKIGHGHVPPL